MPPGAIPDSFLTLLVDALRRHGEGGAITRGLAPDQLTLEGPPVRLRALRPIYGRWLRAGAEARAAIVDEFARLRFGSRVVTDDADAVTDVDVDTDAIRCCASPALAMVRCPACSYLWIYCLSDDACHVDLHATASRRAGARSDKCPSCGTALHLHDQLAPLLPTAADIAAAGLQRYLLPAARVRHGIS